MVESKSKFVPKGTPKGGTRFPRHKIQDALGWAKRLVSKTHLGPQSQDIIFASVVDGKGSNGKIKVSSMKQYGLIDGPASAYEASQLAKSINAAPDGEVDVLIAKAVLTPDIFKDLFDTFHGDEVTRARLRQRALDLKVHPENVDQCVDMYVSAIVFAKLATADGDKITHLAAKIDPQKDSASGDKGKTDPGEQDIESENSTDEEKSDDETPNGDRVFPRAVFHVNVNLDASLDTDKLQRQLALLKKYGAI